MNSKEEFTVQMKMKVAEIEEILDNAAKQNQMDISEKLIKIDGVKRVNIVDQKDELSQ